MISLPFALALARLASAVFVIVYGSLHIIMVATGCLDGEDREGRSIHAHVVVMGVVLMAIGLLLLTGVRP